MELNAKNKIHGNKTGTGQPLYDKQQKQEIKIIMIHGPINVKFKIQVFLY